MNVRKINGALSVTPQISVAEVSAAAADGYKSIIVNRPDGETPGQPAYAEIAAAAAQAGLAARHIPITGSAFREADVAAFQAALAELPTPVLAYCKTGTRSVSLWALGERGRRPASAILEQARAAGYDLSALAPRLAEGGDRASAAISAARYEIVIAGGGAAGIAVAASLLRRKRALDIAIIEPAETHYYQPGWTMVGGGVFKPEQTARPTASLMPRGVSWIKAAVTKFLPDDNAVALEDGRRVRYDRLIVCPGLSLDWDRVEDLTATLGQNGVTSNYRYDLAPYTWELVKSLRSGRALFTQPPMPIKCAGAPQKAMYLSADHWLRSGRLKDIDVAFHNAGAVLFGVAHYVPALMEYVKRYDAALHFNQNLVAIDGRAKKAWFKKTNADGATETIEAAFDMIHVCPPQSAPAFLRDSPLADGAGWADVDPATLRHKRHENVYALGDAANTPNAKTAAAARKQAPIVAENVLCDMGHRAARYAYDGYGSCPLTVERGRIVLAEFAYGGKVAPSFPNFIIDGAKPSRLAWLLKARALPSIYWHGMLKGREWLAKPTAMA